MLMFPTHNVYVMIIILIVPRWNFDDFWHSLILIFRVLCGEWIEPLWDCMRANGEICMVVFLPTLVFGNFVVSVYPLYTCAYLPNFTKSCIFSFLMQQKC